MPELPDVEVFKRYVESTSLHQDIQSVEVPGRGMLRGTSENRLVKSLKGNRFEAARRHGKYLFIQSGKAPWLVLHFGMSGFLKYGEKSGDEPDHVRLRISFSNGYKLLFDCQRKLGEIGLVEKVGDFIEEKGLGPDPLQPDFDLETFKEALGNTRGMIKSALMDQERLAGIGNIYSDEILFQAGIHPKTPADRLEEEDLERLFDKMVHRVLPKAVQAQADPERFPKDFLIPRRHGDGTCPRCGTQLDKIKVGGRTSYVCPSCQPA